MKGYVPQQLNTDRRFSVQTSTRAATSDDDIKPDNQKVLTSKLKEKS